ncbi:MAG: cysteine hydrolase [Acidobacteriaceae bacterium]|nr:cysteine hydrolase [Acidobacteriaceae bacterium]
MPRSNRDLHGSVPDQSPIALLLLDVISDFEFPSADRLLKQAIEILPQLTALKAGARADGIPAIYVNDNFGRWTSDFRHLVDHSAADSSKGKSIARALAPMADDYSVLKPKHSGFFGTSLDLVLKYLGAQLLIVTGFTTDICVAFTAADAYMRGYRLWVPSDCTAALESRYHRAALNYVKRVLGADIRPSAAVDLKTFEQSSR